MATRTKSLVSAATLASAAAVAVAGTAIAPSLNLPTPHALSAAKVQLATFADVLSVPAVEWTDLLFGNTTWGGVLSDTNYGDPSAQPQDAFLQPAYVNPWAAGCAGGCVRSGVTGAAYLFFDALVNGNGLGYDNSSKWSTGVVNYWFEPNTAFPIGGGSSPFLQFVSEGNSAATWYLLQTTIGKAVPQLTVPLAALFWGPTNASVGYNAVLTGVAQLLKLVPVVGPISGNSILAYLGDLPIPGTNPTLYYQYGLSGTLNYWIDIATGSVPFPTATTLTTRSAAAAVAATAAPAAAASVTVPAVKAAESTSSSDATEDTKAPEVKGSDVKGSENEGADNTGSDTKAEDSTPSKDASESTEAPETKTPDSTPEVETSEAPETKPVTTSAVTDSSPAADTPAKPSRPHPFRDAVEKVGNQINSAINDAKAKQAEKAAERAARKAAKNG